MQTALTDAIAEVESILGSVLVNLSRTEKQRAAQLLLDRGVFALRNAVDDVADAMGVSRATIYNYLSARRGMAAAPAGAPDNGS
jgi:predicted transcriptional regulator YheO